jgi:hypothetical protein
VIRRTLALAFAALLVAAVGGTSRAQAAGGTYRVVAGGDGIIGWGPGSGATDQTSDEKLSATGTMTGDTQGHTVGNADYALQSGPGVVRSKIGGSFGIPSNLAYFFAPSLQAISTTELTISAPVDTYVNTSVNIHVDGIIEAPVCGGRPTCGAESVNILVAPFTRVAEFNTLGDIRANDFGLAFDPVPGGYRVHGEVTSAPLGVRTNTPYPIVIALNLSGRYAGTSTATTFGGDFDDPVARYQVSFATSGPVLNDVPAGYTVSGPNVVDNHWTDPFASPSGDVVVTSCADPALAGLTTVQGSLIFRSLPGCPEISLPNLREVHGDLIIENNPDLTRVSFTGPVVVDGSVRIVDNHVANAVDVSGVSGDLEISGNTVGGAVEASGTSGDLTITDNAVGAAIDVSGTGGDLTITDNSVGTAIDASGSGGDLTISGNDGANAIDASGTSADLTIIDNGDAIVNLSDVTTISGNLDLSTAAPSITGVTADGTTTVALLNGAASLHAVLPAGAFDGPVGFTIDYRFDDPPEDGTAADGASAVVDPIGTYVFGFDVPALNTNAQLSFTVDTAQLDAADRATLLNALGSGAATIVGKGDAAGASYAAFPVCTGSQSPAADGCAAISYLAADGTPTTGNPAFVRFDGVVGHFSSYAVATLAPRDTTPPALTVPAGLTVDATGPSGAAVTYAAAATDDRDPSPRLVCSPASGTVFAIGTTTVVCSATDTAGNSSQASFSVHVRGAGEQIVALIDETLAFLDRPALRPALKAQLQAVAQSIVARRPKTACLALDFYVAAVKLAPSRALTPAEKSELVADARRIESVLGCR